METRKFKIGDVVYIRSWDKFGKIIDIEDVKDEEARAEGIYRWYIVRLQHIVKGIDIHFAPDDLDIMDDVSYPDVEPDAKIFVSQPMSGRDITDIESTQLKAVFWFLKNHEGMNVEVQDNIQEEFTNSRMFEEIHPLEYLANDIRLMKDTDYIIFCKGWEKSKGCNVEFLVAQQNNIPMLFM